MKIFFLTNNEITTPLLVWLQQIADLDLVVFEQKITKSEVKKFNPDLIISYNYKYIIEKDVIQLLKNKIINLHISYLPWNKGAHPNVWSFLHDTPHGVTIHLIDEGIDTGNILWQTKIDFDEKFETLSSSYNKLHELIRELFISKWYQMKNMSFNPYKQQGAGSTNYVKDFRAIKHVLGNEGWDISIPLLKKRYYDFKETMLNDN